VTAVRAPVAAAVVALVLAGCGGGQPAPRRQVHPVPKPPVRKVAAKAERLRILPLVPAPRRYGAQRHDQPVPILMYHVIRRAQPGVEYPELWVSGRRFAAQMRALRAAGYHAVTLGQAWTHWRRGLVLPRRPVVVSFDDGFLSQWDSAAQTLRKLGWPGVLNLALSHLGIRGGLSRRQVRELIGAGWELDAHTLTHPDLTTVDAARLHREVAGSRRALRRMFDVPVPFFCYPSGRYDARVEAEVRAAGFRAATTTLPGLATPAGDPYALPRIRVNASDTPAALLARIRALGR
jgi:peptidoglycan/xylan/chitin deacetylase (PgdA/CDA1 family)